MINLPPPPNTHTLTPHTLHTHTHSTRTYNTPHILTPHARTTLHTHTLHTHTHTRTTLHTTHTFTLSSRAFLSSFLLIWSNVSIAASGNNSLSPWRLLSCSANISASCLLTPRRGANWALSCFWRMTPNSSCVSIWVGVVSDKWVWLVIVGVVNDRGLDFRGLIFHFGALSKANENFLLYRYTVLATDWLASSPGQFVSKITQVDN